MKLNQISLFLENKPGHLSHATAALADAGINLLTLSLADTEQFGILRLIVEDWQKARDVLQATGSVVNVTEVVAIEVEDAPGGLTKVLKVVEGAGVNIEYMYAFTARRADKAVMIFRFGDADAAINALMMEGIGVLDKVALFGESERESESDSE